MKVPLRYQITEFDCGTVSILNAISYLYEREEIPALLVKQIHKYMLDCYDENGLLTGEGTSREATDKLTTWLTNYTKNNDFDICLRRLVKEDVNFVNIYECINKGGVVLVRVYQTNEHYVIITKIKNNKFYIFDPYYFDKSYYDKDRDVKMVYNKPFTYNRIVMYRRLFCLTDRDFSMGPIDGRECVLMNRPSYK